MNYVEEGHCGLYKATSIEERRKRKSKRRAREFIDLRFERWQVIRFGEGKEYKAFHKLYLIIANLTGSTISWVDDVYFPVFYMPSEFFITAK